MPQVSLRLNPDAEHVPFMSRPAASFPPPLAPAAREEGLWIMYVYLMVVSGALFPLRFIPINYEWITIAATVGITLYQARRFGAGGIGAHRPVLALIALIILYQSAKALASPEDIDVLQFFRAIYGQIILGFGIAAMATSPLPRDRILHVANTVLLLLTVLVLLSVVTGFRFYATGFLPEASGSDIQSEIASGNYRIITYYSTFVVFLFFINVLSFLQYESRRAALAGIACLILLLLTGTRSLIAPCIAVACLILIRYARPATTISFGIAVFLLVALVYLLIPDIVDAYLSRFYVGQVFDAWRALEQELARQAIGTAPIFGLPMGTPYSHVMSAMAGGTEGYSLNADYDMHNEFLWLMLYFGVIGSVMLFILVITNVLAVIQSTGSSVFKMAFLCYILVMLASMNYSGILLKGYGALIFGLVTGLCSKNMILQAVGRGTRLEDKPIIHAV